MVPLSMTFLTDPNPVFNLTAFLKSNIGKTARLKDKVTIAQEETIPNIWNSTMFGDAPCGLRGCKNGPAPFPGRMSYKATKPGLVFVLYLSMFLLC